MDTFWRSAQGEAVRFRRRRAEALDLALPMNPPTKRARLGIKTKARDALADAFSSGLLVRRARALTNWPKPRADIALDVYLANGPRNGARVDSICKWLLDELAGHVYLDDRQVKLLFAHATRPLPARRTVPEFRQVSEAALNSPVRLHQADLDAALTGLEEKGSEPRQPQLYITAQTRANVLADLRAVSGLDDHWDPFDEDLGLPRKDPLQAMFERDELVDYYLDHNPDSAGGALQRKLIGGRIDFHDQIQQQSVVDLIFMSLLTDLPVDRFGLWSHVSPRIANVPYIVDVGVLPGRGQSAHFRERFRTQLEERRQRWPGLFPMRARSGISMVLFEDPREGKDLDNLIRSVLPDILEVLRPQQRDLASWIAEEADPEGGVPDIPFIEVAAIPAHRTDMAPGSVIFGLSSAERHKSWWSMAADHLERKLEKAEADDYW